jgi:hypothetical protein
VQAPSPGTEAGSTDLVAPEYESLYADWRSADRAAFEAEDRLFRDFEASHRGMIPPPSPQQLDETEMLRNVAGDRLHALIARLWSSLLR